MFAWLFRDPSTVRLLKNIDGLLVSALGPHGSIKRKLTEMSEQLDRLTAEVAEAQQVTQSAITLIQGLAQQIRDAQNDPAALTALADSLDSSTAALAAAVAANTVAEDEEDDEPPVEEPPAEEP